MLIHRNRRHFHLMPTYRPFFNDYLPHSLSKWALHPRLHCAPNFIGKKKIPPPTPPSTHPHPPLFTLIPECVFEFAGCVFEHQWSHGCKCLLSLFFTEIKRNNRGMGGTWWGGVCVLRGGAWWEEMREGRWLSRTSITSPERLCECVRQCGVASLSDCVPCLLKALTFLPTLLLPSLYLSVSLYSVILLPEQRDRSKPLSYLYCQFVKLVLTFS